MILVTAYLTAGLLFFVARVSYLVYRHGSEYLLDEEFYFWCNEFGYLTVVMLATLFVMLVWPILLVPIDWDNLDDDDDDDDGDPVPLPA